LIKKINAYIRKVMDLMGSLREGAPRSGGGERVILQKKSNISISKEPFLILIYS